MHENAHSFVIWKVQDAFANTDHAVIITDVSGKVIAVLRPSEVSEGHQTYDLDLSNAPKGIYMIRVNTGDRMLTQRLIVNQ